jgi:hypothetical protein
LALAGDLCLRLPPTLGLRFPATLRGDLWGDLRGARLAAGIFSFNRIEKSEKVCNVVLEEKHSLLHRQIEKKVPFYIPKYEVSNW